jgi:uncharacterized protein YukE
MGIDTEIKGTPTSIDSAADWLRGTLGTAVDAGADALVAARSTARSDWDGEAGRSFTSTMATAADRADALSTVATSVAGSLDAYATRLRNLQQRMAQIRATAQDAGLDVAGSVIHSPGNGPARPDDPPAGPTSPTAADAYNAAVTAYNEHQDKIAAYNQAVADADDVRTDLAAAAHGLKDEYRGLEGPDWILNASDIAGGLAGAVMEFNSSALRGTADYLSELSRRHLDRLRANPGGLSHLYDDIDHWNGVAQQADDAARNADGLARGGKSIPLKLGGALAVAGIGLDIAGGEDPVQAVASGTGGFAASVAAGAASGAVIGTFVPVPGVGTAAGAVIGAGIGIFTSGAIDSVFENGPDVGAAFDSGVDALTDTGEAIGDGVGAVADGIGGLFD